MRCLAPGSRFVMGSLIIGMITLAPVQLRAQVRGGGWARLGGIVTDRQGKPIEGAQLTLEIVGSAALFTESGADGRYGGFHSDPDAIAQRTAGAVSPGDSFPPGRYLLTVTKHGYDPYAVSLEVGGDMNTVQNVVLNKWSPYGFGADAGLGPTTFNTLDPDVCEDKVLPDFNSAGYDDYSCVGSGSKLGWHVGGWGSLRLNRQVGLKVALSYRNFGKATTTYTGSRIQNDLQFDGGGNFDLRGWSLSAGPFLRITEQLFVETFATYIKWTSSFEVDNQLRSAGQLVNESTDEGSESGTTIGFGAAMAWRPKSVPFAIRAEWLTRSIDDVVMTDVTGLPKNDSGSSFGFGLSYQIR